VNEVNEPKENVNSNAKLSFLSKVTQLFHAKKKAFLCPCTLNMRPNIFLFPLFDPFSSAFLSSTTLCLSHAIQLALSTIGYRALGVFSTTSIFFPRGKKHSEYAVLSLI
jgi:hypothetical protein